MIYFPDTLTPVPNSPGYFWDIKKQKLFSLKVGGVLRELKCRKLHPAAFNYRSFRFTNIQPGDLVYQISVDGRHKYLTVRSLKKLEMVHYTMPVIERVEDEN